MRTASLYQWPTNAKLGRVIPKSKLFEQRSISAKVREEFVSQVQRITWAYKLADETIHLQGDEIVPEIQVLSVDAKGEDISDDVLAEIDKAIQSPIIFEINRDTGAEKCTRMTAAYKRHNGKSSYRSLYFTTEWQPVDAPRARMPIVLNLRNLYSALLTPMIPLEARPGEDIVDNIGRIEQVRKLEREVKLLEKKLWVEPQLNRKVELRRDLNELTAKMIALLDSSEEGRVTHENEDAEWTN